MNRKYSAFIVIIILSLLYLIFISSCATVPSRMRKKDWMAVLPEDVSFYFSFKISSSMTREIIHEVIESYKLEKLDGKLNSMLNKTKTLYGAVKLNNDSPPELHTLMIGRYPSCFLRMGLKLSEEWEKEKNPMVYWVSKKSLSQICIPNKYLIMVSNNRDIVPLVQRYDSPETLRDSRASRESRALSLTNDALQDIEKAELLVFFPTFSKQVFSNMAKKRSAIKEFWVMAMEDNDEKEEEREREREREGEGYFIKGIFNLECEKEDFNKVLRLLLVHLIRKGKVQGLSERLKGLEIIKTGKQVIVKGLYLSNKELTGIITNIVIKK